MFSWFGFSTIGDAAKTVTAILGCCTGVGSAYVYADGPIPAMRHWVQAQIHDMEKATRGIQSEVLDGRLQSNVIERRLLRKEKIDRGLELGRETQPQTRSILQNRLEQIDEDLEVNAAERQRLEGQKRVLDGRPQ